jgi:hypothetical protein
VTKDRFSDDEMRELLSGVLASIRGGEVAEDVQQKVEAAIARRSQVEVAKQEVAIREKSAMPPTPELDKQREIINSGKAEVVQEFIDWLAEDRHYTLCEPKPDSLHGYYLPVLYGGPEQLMADFFGIDRDKIETERRALLAAIQHE